MGEVCPSAGLPVLSRIDLIAVAALGARFSGSDKSHCSNIWLEGGVRMKSTPVPFGRYQRGFGLIVWLLMIPVFLIVLLILAFLFYEGRKAYWDAQVEEMCAKDGHVRIYERVTITKKELDKLLLAGNGRIYLGMKDLTKAEDPVYLESKETNIREANPRVRRTEWSAVRRSDQKVVAQWYSYGRVGGDIPSPAHGSSFRCPDWQQTWIELWDLFLVEGYMH